MASPEPPAARPRPSPPILGLAWGEVRVAGHGTLRDAKLYPGGARPWDWRETGTHHDPGVQVADAEDLLAAGARVLILTRGQQGRLQVPEATVATLEARGARVEVLGTREAVARYNELAEAGEAVGALIHSTC